MSADFWFGYQKGYEARIREQNRRTVSWDKDTGAPLRVLNRSDLDPAMYRFRPVWGKSFTLKFCDDRVPNFDTGVTLKELTYEDRGVCQSIAGKNFGYLVVRDDQEQPIIAANGGIN